MNKKNITGIILAGGKSSRMGTDKGMLVLNGKKIIEYVIAALTPNVSEVIIISNNENYNYLGYKVYKDIVKECGPIGGIFTGLEKSITENNIIVSCDIPNISSTMIAYIISNSDEEDALIPVHSGQPEPLCAVYKKSTAKDFKQLLNSGNYKMLDALKHLKTSYLDVVNAQGFSEDIFSNINTPAEFQAQKLR